MKNLEKKLEEIAEAHLGIPTLRIRNSDRLDFHEVSVWGVKSALLAAYALGGGLPFKLKGTGKRRSRPHKGAKTSPRSSKLAAKLAGMLK